MKIKLTYLFILFSFFTAKAQFGSPVIVDSGILNNYRNILIFDVNNDSKKDIVCSHYLNDIIWYPQNSVNEFDPAQNITTAIPTPYHLDSGDVNGDNFLDILVTNNSGNNSSVHIFTNTNGGQSWSEIILDSSLIIGAFKSFFMDVENDGDLDVITNSDTKILIYKNDGTGNFTPAIIIENANEYYSITIADFNNDGFKDIVANTGGAGIILFENDTNGSFLPSTTIGTGLRIFLTSCDFDNDADIDVISGHPSNLSEVDFFSNNSLGTFNQNLSQSNLDALDVTNAKTIFYDLNDDHFLDILYIENGSLYIKYNNQLGGFNSPTFINSDYNYALITAHDIDNNGKNDIVWFGYDTNVSSYKLGYMLNTAELALNEPPTDMDINIFPNPTNGVLQLNTICEKWEIFNSFGERVLTGTKSNINLEHISSGVYFIKIVTKDHHNVMKKIIKN
ncbi:MAG: T9SS type A sorting domain-containing protein [Putridiphycobacter sp.]